MTTPPPTQAELEAAAAIITCYMPQLEFRSQKNIAQIIAAHRAEPPAEIARLAEALRKAEAEIARDNVIMAEAAQKMDELRAERKAAQEMVATK